MCKMMLDPDRLNRNHVINVRHKDGKYVIVVADKGEKNTWEISWEQWIKEGRNALKD